MDKMIYTAAQGASRILQSQAIRANNLANADTQGFRADLERVAAVPVPETQGSFASRILPQTQNVGFNSRHGEIVSTGRRLDMAIKGDGYFTVQTPQGEAYTRNGAISEGANGELTVAGFPLMGANGPLVLPQYRELIVSEDGRLSIVAEQGGLIEEVAQLKLVNAAQNLLHKGADGLLYANNGEAQVSEQVRLASGALESSNVDAVGELLASMDLGRQFEVQIKLMKSAEKLAEAGNRLLRDA
ncbi:flagellar basal body rod protein FlgF [Shewanella algae]|uniref:flagellar basal body rod protein FlgF n=1 Tax=Shewanella algae TaxID=38313 RepID=UPI001AAD1613|nr:flagellar basal body rod protein FlgF [Shewanella algae]MBO2605541.1 flagellar basal body rod protein FlgF [Shewanella algae]